MTILPTIPPAAPPRRGRTGQIAVFLEMIKFSHSIFALPFAFAAAFLAERGTPTLALAVKIVLACVLARTAAMSFNRWADADIDARNPRTSARAIPAGLLGRASVATAAAISAVLFVAVAGWINSLAFKLSPLALVILLGYSYTKRFTSGSHLVLGLALGLSPLGAWIAVRGELDWLPVLLGLAVLFWTAGFDVIYSCQDVDIDRRENLHSIPRRWGKTRALWLARSFHVLTVFLLVWVGRSAEPSLGIPYHIGVGLVTALLVYEHSLVRTDDLSRVNVAFFTMNGLVSLVFMTATIVDVAIGP